MVGKKITYTDLLTNSEVTDTFYFNLTQAELAELNLGIDGGFDKLSNRFRSKPDAEAMVDIFKRLIWKAVCEKNADGKRVVKSKDISDSFIASDAYSQLFVEMLYSENSDNIINFLSKMIVRKPSDEKIDVAKIAAQAEADAKETASKIVDSVEVIE